MAHKALVQEAAVVLTIFTPALCASLGIVMLMKVTCGLLWHSRCHTRMLGMHHLDETMLVASVTQKQGMIWPRKRATLMWPPMEAYSHGAYLGGS